MRRFGYIGALMVLVSILMFMGAITTQAMAEEFTPPYNDAQLNADAYESEWVTGIAGFYQRMDFSTGRFEQKCSTYAGYLGSAGVIVSNYMHHSFTVPAAGEYAIEFNGRIGYLASNFSETVLLLGEHDSEFEIAIISGVSGKSITKELIKNESRTPQDYLDDTAKEAYSIAIATAANYAGTLVKTGLTILNAVEMML